MIPPEQAEVAGFLAEQAGGPAFETHISAVFRGPDTVWKLKKAVRLEFLDFTALADRRRLLERELALNAPYVPGLYREVVPVVRRDGALALGGEGKVIDWVLAMARVPEGDFLDRMAADGRVDGPVLLGLADAVAAMHARQAVVAGADPVKRMVAVAEGNAVAAGAAGLDAAKVAAWRAGVLAALDRAGEWMRGRAGLVRRAHGDLHLGNMLIWQGRPAPFDALEFDEAMATIDPAYDIAFLLMDLDQRVSRAAANLVLARYVARTGDAGLVGGLAPFLSLRAMIRAHVEAARQRPSASLLAAACAYLQPGARLVLAIGGLMGSGKSTLARALAPGLGAAPGALVVRSDEVRKRLFGATPEERLPREAYEARSNARTEAAFLDQIGAAAGRHAVIADATFMDPSVRAAVAGAARAAGAPFLGVWLDVPLDELERRVGARQNDASDATVAVLRAAAGGFRTPADWMVVPAVSLEDAREKVQTRLGMV